MIDTELSKPLCGQYRPGHFAGVLSIVAKLFNIVEADFAVFGQKDAQQVRLIEAMVNDLSFGIDIRVAPTVREHDGLALSSRNRYLSEDERRQALAISRGLFLVASLFEGGEHDVSRLRMALKDALAGQPGVNVQYADILAYDSLSAIDTVVGKTLVAVAAHVGNTRLIDNVLLDPAGSE